MTDQDIRARILQDIYSRKRAGMEIRTNPQQYAQFLNIPEELANFNIQYLIDAGLVRGKSSGSLGTTKRYSFLYDLTSFGVEAVEGRAGQDLAVNYSIININAPVSQSQIAAGSVVEQTQSLSIDTLQELERYLDEHFQTGQIESLKTQLRELDAQIKAESVKPSTLQKIKDTVTSLGAPAIVVIEVVQKLLNFTSKP